LSTPLSSPTLQAIIESVRNTLNQPDPNSSYWSDQEITEYINDAVRIHFAELTGVDEGHSVTTTTLNIVSGAELVALPSDFFMARGVWKVVSNGYTILQYRNNLTESYFTSAGDSSETYCPSYYFRGNNLVLRPVPQFSETGGLLIEYAQMPASLLDSVDTLTAQVSPIFQQSIKAYAIYMAKLKESLANGVNTYAVAQQHFDALFSQFKSLSAKRSKATTSVIPFNP
jgi:hypothetical protein